MQRPAIPRAQATAGKRGTPRTTWRVIGCGEIDLVNAGLCHPEGRSGVPRNTRGSTRRHQESRGARMIAEIRIRDDNGRYVSPWPARVAEAAFRRVLEDGGSYSSRWNWF